MSTPAIRPFDDDMRRAIPWIAREGPMGFALSAISGFIDTSGFILLAGLFTAHVTGNFVLAGAAIAGSSDHGILGRLTMFPVFMVGVMLASLLAGDLRARGKSVVGGMLWYEAGLLGAFMLAGTVLRPETQTSSDGLPVMIVGAMGVLAMAIQNALMREGLPNMLPTTVMTGNLTQFSMDLLLILRSAGSTGTGQVDKAIARRHRLAPVMGGFLTGCAMGAVSASLTGFGGTLLPVLLTAWLARVNGQPQPEV